MVAAGSGWLAKKAFCIVYWGCLCPLHTLYGTQRSHRYRQSWLKNSWRSKVYSSRKCAEQLFSHSRWRLPHLILLPHCCYYTTAAVKMHRLKSFSLLSPEKHSTSSENPFCKINFSDRNLADVLLYHCPFGFSARSENKINSGMFLCLHGNAFCNTWRRPITDWRQHKVLFVYL